MTRTLAFGDDRSSGADTCWGWIVNQGWEGWNLEVITAEPPADMHPVAPEDAELHRWDPDEPRDPGDQRFDSVTHLRAEIDPRVALIARTWDLVAVGPRGHGLLKSLHLGSTADWLLREPASPLVIARRSGAVARVLLAADGSAHARRAIETLASFPWIEGVNVRIVTVDDGRADPAALLGATETMSSAGAEIDSAILTGSPTQAILDEIDESGPDLVVMGARGLAGIKRLVLGSTTAAVARSTDCSILVAHARAEDID